MLWNRKWYSHAFIILNYKVENNNCKLSLEFRKEGYLMRFDERVEEGRYTHAESGKKEIEENK